MSYKRKQKKTFILEFEGEYEGLEIEMKSPNISQYLEIVRLTGNDNEDTIEDLEKTIKFVLGFMNSWNMTDENDVPVPLTYESLTEEDPTLFSSLLSAWVAAFSEVSPDLKKDLNSGETFPMPTMTMEAL